MKLTALLVLGCTCASLANDDGIWPRTPQDLQAEAEPEKRIDPSDGAADTQAEFIDAYGGTDEWDAAAPPS